MVAATETMIAPRMTKNMLRARPIARRSALSVVMNQSRKTWSSGDCSIVGARLQIVAESLCARLGLQRGQRVLDMGSGNGNVAVSAGRRRCQVDSITPRATSDHIEALLERSKEIVIAERLNVDVHRTNATSLPFDDGHFDAVSSDFGLMFAADQERVADELLRVCRPGGKIGLANWTPDGFMGRLFNTIAKHVPEPANRTSPFRWGTSEYVSERFDAQSSSIDITPRTFTLHYKTPQHWLDLWRSHFAPLKKAFESIDARARDQLAVDLLALIDRCNVATDGSVMLRANYLEIVVQKLDPPDDDLSRENW